MLRADSSSNSEIEGRNQKKQLKTVECVKHHFIMVSNVWSVYVFNHELIFNS